MTTYQTFLKPSGFKFEVQQFMDNHVLQNRTILKTRDRTFRTKLKVAGKMRVVIS